MNHKKVQMLIIYKLDPSHCLITPSSNILNDTNKKSNSKLKASQKFSLKRHANDKYEKDEEIKSLAKKNKD